MSRGSLDYAVSAALQGYVYRADQLRPALRALGLISNDWDVASRTESILQRVVHKLGKSHLPAAPLPRVPLALSAGAEDKAVWREFCLDLAEWGVSLVESPEDSELLLRALLERADRLGSKWGSAVRSVVRVQSRLCDLGLELGDEPEAVEESAEGLAQGRQDLAWELARFRPIGEAEAVLETLQGDWCLGQAVRFVCDELLGRGLVEEALAMVRRFDPGSSTLLRVAGRMRELGTGDVRAVVDEMADPSSRLWALLEFAECYEAAERDARVRSLIEEVASGSVAPLYFAYARLSRAGYEQLFWESVPQNPPYQVLIESCAEDSAVELSREVILRSLEEPMWAWEMVAALVPLYPERTTEIGEFMLSRYVEPQDDGEPVVGVTSG